MTRMTRIADADVCTVWEKACKDVCTEREAEERLAHGLINYIENKSQCFHVKKIYLYRDFTAGVYLSEAQNPITPPPPLHTVYIFALEGGEGGELNQREG